MVLRKVKVALLLSPCKKVNISAVTDAGKKCYYI